MESFRGRATNIHADFVLCIHVYISSFHLTLKLAGVDVSISYNLLEFLVIQRRILNGINFRASNEMDK